MLTCNVNVPPDLPDEGPVITGTLPIYNTGDTLVANCSSFNSFPSASLNWYINGQVAPQKHLWKTCRGMDCFSKMHTQWVCVRDPLEASLGRSAAV